MQATNADTNVHCVTHYALPFIVKKPPDLRSGMEFGECQQSWNDLAHTDARRHFRTQNTWQLSPRSARSARLGDDDGPGPALQQPHPKPSLEIRNDRRHL